VTLRPGQTRVTRARVREQRGDTQYSTGSAGLTNSRTRIVGTRTGPAADAVITAARMLRAVRRVLARGIRRITGVVTPVGWATIAFVPFGLIVGYLFNWVELDVIGYTALVLVLFAVVYLVGRGAYAADLVLLHNPVVVGETARGAVTVHNPLRRRSLSGAVEVPIGDALAEVSMPGIARRSSLTREFSIPTSHRGVVRVGPARIVRADPIGLVRREVVWSGVTELYVHPRTVAIPSVSSGFIRDLEGTSTRDLTSSDIAFHALREYTPGDERRSIHWKTTARTGRYMVRQFEETRRSHLMIGLSLAGDDFASDEEFELAVSVAASLGARAIRDTRQIAVVVSGTTPEFAARKVFSVTHLSVASRARLLDDLAVVERSAGALTVSDLARVAGSTVPGVSTVFLIVGSSVPASTLRAASTQFPPGVEVIAIVCDPGAVPDLRRVTGLSVLVIGLLDDLRRSLARVVGA
jgi:hypothetical protein